MSLRIFVGAPNGYETLGEQAILFDSVTDIAFGRIFYADRDEACEVAQAFLDWCEKEKQIPRGDVRSLTTQATIALQDEFLKIRKELGL
jgi:hypothetical protein